MRVWRRHLEISRGSIWSQTAVEDLREIVRFIAWGDPAFAANLANRIVGHIDYVTTLGTGRPACSATVLTMQARKSDIDAFARGAIDFDQFRRKVKTPIY